MNLAGSFAILLASFLSASQAQKTLESTQGSIRSSRALEESRCVAAPVIAVPSLTSGDTTGADASTQTSTCNGTTGNVDYDGGGVAYYKFIGTGNLIEASTCGGTTNFDTQITIWDSCDDSATCVDANDEYCGNQSTVRWLSVAGVEYIIMVHGWEGDEGTFDLTISELSPPPNDDFCNATNVGTVMPAGGELFFSFSNEDATSEPGEPTPDIGSGASDSCLAQNGWCVDDPDVQNSVWYTFDVDGPMCVDISMEDPSLDLQFALYEVVNSSACAPPTNFQLVAANDDGVNADDSSDPEIVSAPVEMGKTYALQVDGYDGATGTDNITIQAVSCPTESPTGSPTVSPVTGNPTSSPSKAPTTSPVTKSPTGSPNESPTASPVPPPSNDDFCNATNVGTVTPAGGELFFSFSNVGATDQPGEPVPPGNGCNTQDGWCDQPSQSEPSVQNSVWYTFDVDGPTCVDISFDDPTQAEPDLQFALYEVVNSSVCAPANFQLDPVNFQLIAANDDGGGENMPQINSAPVEMGETYALQVDGYNAAEGTGNIRIQAVSCPTESPTGSPTGSPVTGNPTSSPSKNPTNSPSMSPVTESPTSSPSKSPSLSPSMSPVTKSPTGAPTVKPSKSPTSGSNLPSKMPTKTPTSAPTVFQDLLQFNVFGGLVLTGFTTSRGRKLQADPFNGLSDSSVAVIEVTIADEITSTLDPNRVLIDVEVFRITGLANALNVEYRAIIQEQCTAPCANQAITTTIADDLDTSFTAAISSGSFTSALQSNAAACGTGCSEIQSASVVSASVSQVDVVIVTNNTTAPTESPTMSPTVDPFNFPKLEQVADDGKWYKSIKKNPDGTRVKLRDEPLGPCQGDCDGDDHCLPGYWCFHRCPSNHGDFDGCEANALVPGCYGVALDGTSLLVGSQDQDGNNDGLNGENGEDYCAPIPEDYFDPVKYLKYNEDNSLNTGEGYLTECQGECNEQSDCAEGLTCFRRSKDTRYKPVPGCEGQGERGVNYCYNNTANPFA